MKSKIKFCEFIKKDIEKISAEANFNAEQTAIFEELCAGHLTDIGIAQKLNLSESSFYARKKVVLGKIARIMQAE